MTSDAKHDVPHTPDEIAKPAENQPDKSKEQADATPGRSRPGMIARYVMLGFAPLVAIIALVVAGFAVSGNRTSQVQLGNISAQLKNANAALSASKAEIANLKSLVANLNAKQVKEQKSQETLTRQIVQNVSRLQVKAKISPTLEEQLQQPASSSVGIPPAASAKAIPPAAATEIPRKNGPQVQAIKEAIDTFNKNGSKKR